MFVGEGHCPQRGQWMATVTMTLADVSPCRGSADSTLPHPQEVVLSIPQDPR
jgi:hypothetical protein